LSQTSSTSDNRRVRVFVSSTFRDMIEDRDELMSHAWPELRRFCRERQVELVEVDLRWGISEEQSTRKETLRLCLDEIRACRPYFIALLGERYGWTPGDDAFTADLCEEQPWLRDLKGKSVTELEILHGVLNNPEMAGRAFFYFRDPAYAQAHGTDFQAEDRDSASKQTALKALIRKTCAAKDIPLRENYPDPRRLAEMVLEDLRAAIDAQFPVKGIPDPLAREARDHEAFAESRRRTYIGRPEYFDALDRQAAGGGGPLLLAGESGGGKSALLANWIDRWRADHPTDFIFQHYIGGTADSADHWRLMGRLAAEIKGWTGDEDELPRTHEDILKTFPLWLAKARIYAQRKGVRCIIMLDALNQLEDHDHARLLGWLPEHPFTGPLRLIASTLPGDVLKAAQQRGWAELSVQSLTPDERRRMIAEYLSRYAKKLDPPRVERLAAAAAAANPLYLKILLDELRVTGTHERLDERLDEYLVAADIPTLLRLVLERYRRDYERDRPGLVSEALGLIWAARRGLSETELLCLLKPADEAQLPAAIWNPLRAALEESLVDRGGILNFAHDFLRAAVEAAFVGDQDRQDDLRIQLADFFEAEPITARTCDELPWLLREAGQRDRLRSCLLDIDRFLLVHERDREELMRYWVWLKEERTMGEAYLASFDSWSAAPRRQDTQAGLAAGNLGHFLKGAALYASAESLYRRAMEMCRKSLPPDHPDVAVVVGNLAELLRTTNRLQEAEPLMRRVLETDEKCRGPRHPSVARDLNNLAGLLRETNRLKEAEAFFRRAMEMEEEIRGPDHPNVSRVLSNLAQLLQATSRFTEAEPLYRRALEINEKRHGRDHPAVATVLANLAGLLRSTNRFGEAEPLFRRALEIDEKNYGGDHPEVATDLTCLAEMLRATNRWAEAEPLMRRALEMDERSYGCDHPKVARDINNLTFLLCDCERWAEAEPLMRRTLEIDERSYGGDHPTVARDLNNLGRLFQATNRLKEAESFYRRAQDTVEKSLGPDHVDVATILNNLAQVLQATGRLGEAEPLMRRVVAIYEKSFGRDHPDVAVALHNLAGLLHATNRAADAELMMRRALEISEASHGKDHPLVAACLGWLGYMLKGANRLTEAEPLIRRVVEIFTKSTAATGNEHPRLRRALEDYGRLLIAMGRSEDQAFAEINKLMEQYGMGLDS